jgi:general secretion pathway protein I
VETIQGKYNAKGARLGLSLARFKVNESHSAKRGFTLIEVLLAVAVLSLGLIAIVGSFGRSLDAMGSAVSAVEATAVLEETLWRVKADPETYLRQGEGSVEGFGDQVRWKVESRPDPFGMQLGDPLQHVWVSVGWDEGGSRRSVGASTLVWTPTVSSGEGG